ncbi:chromosome partitioning protein ParB [Alloprevotella tannerae]|nr:chromosome partitioning protein ParB [Alloprevotella tannerae]
MIGKSFLGESLKSLIGELKLSYRRIFRITGESLAAVRSALRGGGPGGIFIPKYAMKPRFFALLSFLYRHIFA